MNNLLKLRKEKNLTRPELAAKSGVPASTIHKLEAEINDLKGAKADTLYKLATALDTTVEYLLKHYLRNNIGTVFYDAELKGITSLTKEEWNNLEWKDTELELGYNNGKNCNTVYDVAKYLECKPFAKLFDEDGKYYGMGYCYEKDGKLYVFVGSGAGSRTAKYAEIPRSIKDAFESYK